MYRLPHAPRAVLVAVAGGVLLATVLAVATTHDWFESRPHPGRLLDFDLESGQLRFDVATRTASAHLHALGDGLVIVTGADTCDSVSRERISAYSLGSGGLRWSHGLKGACTDYAAPDPISRGIVAVDSDPGIDGLDASTGASRWHTALFQDPPRQSSRMIVSASSSSGRIRYLDPRNGRVVRTVTVQGRPAIWTATQAATVLYVQKANALNQLTAIDPGTGRRLWSRPTGGSTSLQELTADGVTIVGSTTGDLTFAVVTYTALDLQSGRRLWTRRDPLPPDRPTGDLVAVGGGLALFVRDGTLTAHDLRSGALRWTRSLPGWRANGYSEIVAGDGCVAVIDPDRLTVLRARDGAARWSAALSTDGVRAHGPGAITNGQLVIPSISSGWTPYDE